MTRHHQELSRLLHLISAPATWGRRVLVFPLFGVVFGMASASLTRRVWATKSKSELS
ncbi:hypothetical protein PMIN01_09682 [Paraphaeosphaeria minitans]|uniref:Uncharacterized protein n=1 Tax=Paraphaeosphaeria minitans TaxID=565426 RepID=A0A9P6GCD8_9PLEO|nr:hypothetical protein PMIN01_09682 [Paraphaeosphaeria minitans]